MQAVAAEQRVRRTPQAAAEALAALQQQHLRRSRRTVQGYDEGAGSTRPRWGDAPLLNFCGNDYLGLARDPRLTAALTGAAQHWGVGSGASHLVTGHTREHQLLEEELAAFTGRESALLFSTGYMANLGVVSALCGRSDTVLQDRLNHASLIDGARLSGARLLRYRHNEVADAERLLPDVAAPHSTAGTLLATDGVFSMDGDLAPVAALAQLAQRRAAWLLVDDAHGLGVLGARGGGVLELAGLTTQQVPLLVGTLGKALGTFGAFVAGERDLIDYILQRARSYIYTTALPPAVAAATRVALTLVRDEPWRREHLAGLIARFRKAAAREGLALGESMTPIQPVLLGDAALAVSASQALQRRGDWVTAIRAPTVPAGTERLRVTLSVAHDEAQVDGLVTALAESLVEARAAAGVAQGPT